MGFGSVMSHSGDDLGISPYLYDKECGKLGAGAGNSLPSLGNTYNALASSSRFTLSTAILFYLLVLYPALPIKGQPQHINEQQ